MRTGASIDAEGLTGNRLDARHSTVEGRSGSDQWVDDSMGALDELVFGRSDTM